MSYHTKFLTAHVYHTKLLTTRGFKGTRCSKCVQGTNFFPSFRVD